MADINSFIKEFLSKGSYIEAHTSGSTGKPKTIRLAKEDMRQSARATNARFGICSTSLLASPLSVDYIAGKMMAVRALEANCRLIELPVSNTIYLPDDIGDIDLLPVVPSQIPSLTAHPEYSSRIRNLLIGGAAPSDRYLKALDAAGYNTYVSYGMTETCSHVAIAGAEDSYRIFKAMPGISFSIDSRSCLSIIAPHFSFGTLQTNDVVELLSDVSFIWRGRADNTINSGGLKLHPEELEKRFAAYLPTMDFYLTSAPHPLWGEALVLVVEGDEALASKSDMLLKASGIDSRMLPKRVVAIEKMPRTDSGKIRRLCPPEFSF